MNTMPYKESSLTKIRVINAMDTNYFITFLQTTDMTNSY